MKHALSSVLFACLAMMVPLAATETTVAFQTSNFAFDDEGKFNPATFPIGGLVRITDQIQGNLDGTIQFVSDPVYGNSLSARATYHTAYLDISAGPTFGVLNSGTDPDNILILFQPGLGIGFSVTVPGVLVASADTDFALPPAESSDGQVYLRRSELSAGFYLPNVLCTLGITQRNSSETGSDAKIKSMTDYGLYTTAFRKGSAFRVGVNFIYRVADYYIASGSDANRKIGNLVLGGGLTWAPKADFNLFVDGNGTLYSFSLGDKVTGLDSFLFELRAGMQIKTQGLPSR